MAACPHGRRLSRCKECGGEGICEHGRERRRCKECGGEGICEHGREHRRCKECSGTSLCLCEHGQCTCKECHVSTLDVVTLEATAIEECEGEEGPHFEVKSATRPEYLATLQTTCPPLQNGCSRGPHFGNGGQVVSSAECGLRVHETRVLGHAPDVQQGNGGQVVWSVAKIDLWSQGATSGLVDSQTALS